MGVSILSIALFLSGVSALVFETLWLRLSGLAFGNSVWAAALILSSFMGGLAVGNLIAALTRQLKLRPLYVYALLEVAIALLGSTIVYVLPVLGVWIRPVFQALWAHQPFLIGLRFVFSFVILLAPASAMGLTLPVLVEDPVLRRDNFATTVGLLYGCNTLGAVVGAILGEAYLIQKLGLRGTGIAAALFNCVAGLMAMLLSTRSGNIAREVPLARPRPGFSAGIPWRLVIGSFGAGMVFLTLEVVWFRFLRLFVASSSTAFAIMLAIVLAGIGAGGVVAAIIHRAIKRIDQLLPIVCILSAVSTLVCYVYFPIASVHATAGPFYFDQWQEIVPLTLALVFPVSLLSGILLPSIIGCVQRKLENRMTSVGLTTLANTIGATFGPLLAGFVLLPNIGFQWSLILCAAIYAALAAVLSNRQTWSVRRPQGTVMLLTCGIWLWIIATFPYHRQETHFAHARLPYEGSEGSKVVRIIEGTSDTCQLLRRDFLGQPYYYRLVTNAFSMSSTSPRYQRYMRLFAYLPLALSPNAENALLICYGCGVTADALTRDSRLKRIDIVDISKEVFSLAPYYTTPDYADPLRDPRVSAIVQDGRFYLQACPRRYDLITGEPPPLKVQGTVNLYTQEFFSLMRSRLKEGGIATFWLPIYQLRLDETKAILRAFRNTFPEASVWGGANGDWILMGMNGHRGQLTTNEMSRLWKDSATGRDLRRIGVEVPEQMAALFLMDGNGIDRMTGQVSPLIDQYPKRLTDLHPDERTTNDLIGSYVSASGALERFFSSSTMQAIWPELSRPLLEKTFLVRETRYRSVTNGTNALAELDFYLRNSDLRAPVLDVMGTDEARLAIAERVTATSLEAPVEAIPDLVAGAVSRRDIGAAVKLMEGLKSRRPLASSDLFLLTYLYCLNGDVDKAEALAAQEIGPRAKGPFLDWFWAKLRADFGFHPPA